jgi:hypothetical protein
MMRVDPARHVRTSADNTAASLEKPTQLVSATPDKHQEGYLCDDHERSDENV